MRSSHARHAFAALGPLLLAAAVLSASGQQSPRELYERARLLDEVGQNLAEAIRLYGQVADSAKDQPALAARALVQMGRCQERLGHAEARKAYQRVIDEYPQQLEEVKLARERLAALSRTAATQPGAKFTRIRIPSLRPSWTTKLSPDGKAAALVSDNDLWVVQLTGKVAPDISGEPKRLTSSGTVSQSALSWSSDGKWIAYNNEPIENSVVGITVISPNGRETKRFDLKRKWINWKSLGLSLTPSRNLVSFTSTGSEDEFGMEIVEMSVDTGEKRVLAGDYVYEPAYSPDGTRLAYVQWLDGTWRKLGEKMKFSRLREMEKTSEVRVIVPQGGKSTLVARVPSRAVSPVWSPDGIWIAFLPDWNSKEVWIAPASGEGTEPIKIALPYAALPNIAGWTPENKIGLIFSPTEARGAVYTVPAYGGRATQVTPDGVIYECRWAPDGRHIYFRNTHEISSVPREGGDVSTVPIKRPREHFMALPGAGNTISPDGKTIALSWCQVGTVPASGGELTRLTNDPWIGCDRYPSWSPDGKLIAFIRERSQKDIYVVPAQGGDERRITTGADKVSSGKIEWSPDGKWIAFFSSDKQIKIIPAEGGPSRTIVQLDTGLTVRFLELTWSPDSQRLAYASTGCIWVVPILGGEPNEVKTGVDAYINQGLAWSPDGSTIAFVGHKGGESELWLMEDFLPLVTRGRK